MKKLLKLIVHKFSDMKLQTKMLFLYLFVIIIPFFAFSFISSNRASVAIEELVKFSARQSFDQTEAFMEYKIWKVVDTSKVLLSDTRINNILAKDPDEYPINEQIRDLNTLSNFLSSFINKEDIYNVRLYVNEGFEYSNEGMNLGSIASVREEEWFDNLSNMKSNLLWVPLLPDDTVSAKFKSPEDRSRLISLTRLVYDSNNYTKNIGLLRIDILEEKILEILKKASPTQNSIVYLMNSKSEIISASGDDIQDWQKISYITLDTLIANGFFSDSQILHNEKHLVSCQQIPDTDWIMVSITPYDEILAVSRRIKYEILIIFVIIGVLAFTIANLLSYSITKRIKALIANIKKIKKGDFESKIISRSKDEIGELITDFNDMNTKLSFLVSEQRRIGQDMKHYELIALQAQINPHFLYNTLDLINWTAINKNVPEISQTVQSLSKFFKISLSKGSNIIPIQDEVEHVRLYMEIQNQRYNDAFNFEIDIDEDVYGQDTIKTILQPIIENSVIHGILAKEEKRGTIKLTGRMDGDIIVLAVSDDGVGIPQDQADEILSKTDFNPLHGYGIRNIDERIKLYYGKDYGLSFESGLGKGTVVTIRFPKTPILQ